MDFIRSDHAQVSSDATTVVMSTHEGTLDLFDLRYSLPVIRSISAAELMMAYLPPPPPQPLYGPLPAQTPVSLFDPIVSKPIYSVKLTPSCERMAVCQFGTGAVGVVDLTTNQLKGCAWPDGMCWSVLIRVVFYLFLFF